MKTKANTPDLTPFRLDNPARREWERRTDKLARANTPKTKVIFRRDRAKAGEVIALFPADAGTYNPGTCSAYVHLGQHLSADLFQTVQSTRLAKPSEYRELARELRRIGYRLDIRKRATRADYEERKAQIARPIAPLLPPVPAV